LIVGVAVRIGSENRGGWFYQLVAIGMTYLAIAFTYMPSTYAAAKDVIVKERQAEARQLTATTPAEQRARLERPEEFTAKGKAYLGVIAFVFSMLWPFDFSVMGYIIKGIALYEAWKINKKPALLISGPFAMGSSTATVPDGTVPAS
jgi:hypothetical protein